MSGTTDVAWYVYDGLGSVVGEVDVTGSLTATKDHDVYGLTRNVTGTPTSRHGFVGSLGHTEDDETSYSYMRARHYDPETGRFASEDPARDGLNWFAYCSNNPTNAIDPTGKASEWGIFASLRLQWEKCLQTSPSFFIEAAGFLVFATLLAAVSQDARDIKAVVELTRIFEAERLSKKPKLLSGGIGGQVAGGIVGHLVCIELTMWFLRDDFGPVGASPWEP